MNTPNPYQSPETDPDGCAFPASSDGETLALPIPAADALPAVSTADTIVPRHIAAIVDSVIALTLGVVAAKSFVDDMPLVQLPVFALVYLGYYLLLEGLLSRTPGKLLTGLVVVQFDGRRCSWRQALIRTAFRVLEVNPALLGAIPAALSIILSRHHQRLGDKAARTIVVPARRLRKRR